MQDQEFLSQFENCCLPKSEFKHRNHLRLTWLYLSKYDVNEAKERIKQGIIRYARSLGAAHIYHETLTCVWIDLVKQAIDKEACVSFDDFLKQHPHLLDKTLADRYYSKPLLENELARKEYLPPDIKTE